MRHKGVKKEETRRKILAAAGQGFNAHGYAGIGVDGLAKAAGVTSGAFYSHFGSKDAAFDVVLAAGLDDVIEAVPKYQQAHGSEWVVAFADYYLSRDHRDDLAGGCAMAALTSEVVRSSPKVHAAYERKMNLIAELVVNGLAGDSDSERRARAWAMLGVLIGGVNMARALKGVKLAGEVASAMRKTAIEAAGQTR